MTAAHTRRRRAPGRLAHVALVASVLFGLAAMHGVSSVVVSGGGHGPVSLPVVTDGPATHADAHATHGVVAAHQVDDLAGGATAALAASDRGSHHSLVVGCALALTGILTLAVVWLIGRDGQRLVRRMRPSRAGPRPAPPQRAGPRPVPRFSLCVLRT